MALPLGYTLRNLWTRRLTTALTISGMALVVFVFAAILMLAEGLQTTLVETGVFDNVVAIRKGSVSEVQSGVPRDQAAILETEREIALGPDGRPLFAKELVVLVTLPKRVSGDPGNVVLRGIGPSSLPLRPQVKLMAGRLPRPGSLEMMAGSGIAKRFQGGGLNESLCCGMRNWRIVGVFDAGNRGYSSEIWGDADQLMAAFRRPAYSSTIFRLRNSGAFESIRERLEGDPRLTVEVKRETKYYADQSEMMAKFLRIVGLTLTLVFSLGAMIGAMITMYAAVANRTGEIGTLRALGFQRRSILLAFLLESLLLGLLGGVVGLFLASFLQLITVSTMNFQTFSELAFSFSLTPGIIGFSMIFSLAMGFVGGVLPALRAARMQIVDALRTG
ncbi:ABC transporter permease [Syntrophus buswellii]|uniref:ABC transporter permease n=1 Tax=Syntrophus TaxID=43773 RepID=UPI0009D37629|nr:MAG: Macrolide export ATP-binding/permease protein MacB [Syntrophus sp. PtaB.Bin138]